MMSQRQERIEQLVLENLSGGKGGEAKVEPRMLTEQLHATVNRLARSQDKEAEQRRDFLQLRHQLLQAQHDRCLPTSCTNLSLRDTSEGATIEAFVESTESKNTASLRLESILFQQSGVNPMGASDAQRAREVVTLSNVIVDPGIVGLDALEAERQ
jgi:hypothetical protein